MFVFFILCCCPCVCADAKNLLDEEGSIQEWNLRKTTMENMFSAFLPVMPSLSTDAFVGANEQIVASPAIAADYLMTEEKYSKAVSVQTWSNNSASSSYDNDTWEIDTSVPTKLIHTTPSSIDNNAFNVSPSAKNAVTGYIQNETVSVILDAIYHENLKVNDSIESAILLENTVPVVSAIVTKVSVAEMMINSTTVNSDIYHSPTNNIYAASKERELFYHVLHKRDNVSTSLLPRLLQEITSDGNITPAASTASSSVSSEKNTMNKYANSNALSSESTDVNNIYNLILPQCLSVMESISISLTDSIKNSQTNPVITSFTDDTSSWKNTVTTFLPDSIISSLIDTVTISWPDSFTSSVTASISNSQIDFFTTPMTIPNNTSLIDSFINSLTNSITTTQTISVANSLSDYIALSSSALSELVLNTKTATVNPKMSDQTTKDSKISLEDSYSTTEWKLNYNAVEIPAAIDDQHTADILPKPKVVNITAIVTDTSSHHNILTSLSLVSIVPAVSTREPFVTSARFHSNTSRDNHFIDISNGTNDVENAESEKVAVKSSTDRAINNTQAQAAEKILTMDADVGKSLYSVMPASSNPTILAVEDQDGNDAITDNTVSANDSTTKFMDITNAKMLRSEIEHNISEEVTQSINVLTIAASMISTESLKNTLPVTSIPIQNTSMSLVQTEPVMMSLLETTEADKAQFRDRTHIVHRPVTEGHDDKINILETVSSKESIDNVFLSFDELTTDSTDNVAYIIHVPMTKAEVNVTQVQLNRTEESVSATKYELTTDFITSTQYMSKLYTQTIDPHTSTSYDIPTYSTENDNGKSEGNGDNSYLKLKTEADYIKTEYDLEYNRNNTTFEPQDIEKSDKLEPKYKENAESEEDSKSEIVVTGENITDDLESERKNAKPEMEYEENDTKSDHEPKNDLHEQEIYWGPLIEHGPLWEIAKKEWKEAWEFHVFFFGVCFSLLALYTITNCVRVWNIEHVLSRKYFIILHVLVIAVCLLRGIYLLVDGYNSFGTFSIAVDHFIYSIAFPCITALFSILFYALILATRSNVMCKSSHIRWVLVLLLSVHFCLSIVKDIVVAFLSHAILMILICKIYFIVWGFFIFVGYMILFKKLYNVAIYRQRALTSLVHEHKLSIPNSCEKLKYVYNITLVVKLALISAFFGLVLVGFELYGLFGVYGILNKEKPHPWPWWAYKSMLRSFELLMCLSVTYIASRPLKYVSKKKFEHKLCQYLSPCYIFKENSIYGGESCSATVSLDNLVTETDYFGWFKKKSMQVSTHHTPYPPHTSEQYTDPEATLQVRRIRPQSKPSMLVVEDGFVRIRREDEILPSNQYELDSSSKSSQSSDINMDSLGPIVDNINAVVNWNYKSEFNPGQDGGALLPLLSHNSDLESTLCNFDNAQDTDVDIDVTENVLGYGHGGCSGATKESGDNNRPVSMMDLAASMESELDRAFHSSTVMNASLRSDESL